MSDRLVVNFPALQQAAGDINNAVNTMESTLSDAEAAAAPLIQTWEGQAQEAYHARQTQWRQAAGALTTMLREIKSAVEQSASEYQAAETRNANLFA